VSEAEDNLTLEELRDTIAGGMESIYPMREANALVSAYVEALADRLKLAVGNDDSNNWDWWDAATIPTSCAELLIRIDKEATRDGG